MPEISEDELLALREKATTADGLKAKVNELEEHVSGNKTDEAQLLKLQKDLEGEKSARQSTELLRTKEKVIGSFDNLKGLEGINDMVSGKNQEELIVSAKLFSERLQKRDDELRSKWTETDAEKWEKIPRSVPNNIGVTKDRKDEYLAVRQDKNITRRTKIGKLMGMHIVDNSKNVVNGFRDMMGLPPIQN